MDYRKIDPEQVTEQALLQYAEQAEQAALASALDLARQGENAGKDAKVNAETSRKRANFLRDKAQLTDSTVAGLRQNYYDGVLSGLESQIAVHELKLDLKTQMEFGDLEADKADGVTIDNHRRSLSELKKAHAHVLEQMGAGSVSPTTPPDPKSK